MIAQGIGTSEVANRLGVCARTVRRWICRYRQGLGVLERAPVAGRPNSLSEIQISRVKRDLERPPAEFGYQTTRWSGALLVRHLRECYGVALGACRCRQLLRRFGAGARESTLKDRVLEADSGSQASARIARIFRQSSISEPDRLLRQMKRLASSGLPLEPFVHGIFEILATTFDMAHYKTLLADPRPPFTRYIVSDPAILETAAASKHYCIDAPSEVSGTININSPHLRSKAVWMHEEIVLPHYYQSAGYNEVMRRLDFHHCMVTMLMEEGEMAGRWPLWRTREMKPWSREESGLMTAVAPYIAHGLNAGRQITAQACRLDQFVSLGATAGTLVA